MKEAFKWIELKGAYALEIAVLEIRSAAKNAIMESNITKGGQLSQIKDEVYLPNEKANVYKQVERLLRLDANLSASRASEMLIAALEENEQYRSKSFPRLGKKSFRKWVEQLSKITPPSIILHNATKIRNSIVHSPEIDWPLRK